MQALVNKYISTKGSHKELLTEPISGHLLPILQQWWWEPSDWDKIKEVLTQCQHPSNADPVRQVFINEELFKCIGQAGRETDKDLCYINHAVTKGSQPLVTIWDNLI